jgi:hypothetical protein
VCQVQGRGDVEVDDPGVVRQVDVGERPALAHPGVQHGGGDRPAGGEHRPVQLLDAVVHGEVRPYGDDVGTAAAQLVGGVRHRRVLGADHEVEPVLGEHPGQGETDAAGGPGHHRQGLLGVHGPAGTRGRAVSPLRPWGTRPPSSRLGGDP